ncbi:uncharacterized protein TrAtP1_001988 [Trichoderma atroviride]|uniref:uncharacterized protein n=1 Tax=Hypocrea atroviridis TaxID=63577 RepID=UPI003326AD7D|nr:hypothetical protein TrAtP1_001988 [Trichoderma atroviride]
MFSFSPETETSIWELFFPRCSCFLFGAIQLGIISVTLQIKHLEESHKPAESSRSVVHLSEPPQFLNFLMELLSHGTCFCSCCYKMPWHAIDNSGRTKTKSVLVGVWIYAVLQLRGIHFWHRA